MNNLFRITENNLENYFNEILLNNKPKPKLNIITIEHNDKIISNIGFNSNNIVIKIITTYF